MDTVDEVFEHFGVKGMHWGVRRSKTTDDVPSARAQKKTQKTSDKRKAAADQVKYHEHASAELTKEAQRHVEMHNDLMKNGLNSKAAEEVLGKGAGQLSNGQFFVRYGASKQAALRQVDYQIRTSHNQLQSLANAHAKRAEKLKKKHDLEHSDEVELQSPEEAIMHFGVKGMKWGVRRGAGTPRAPSSEDKARADELASKVKVGGGHHVLSNTELEALTKRLNLEQQYARLSTTDVKRGEDVVKSSLGKVKMTLDAIETGKRVYQTVEDAKKLAKK